MGLFSRKKEKEKRPTVFLKNAGGMIVTKSLIEGD